MNPWITSSFLDSRAPWDSPRALEPKEDRVTLTSGEKARLRRIQTLLVGTGKPENVADDARHIFEAQTYGSY